VDSSSSRRSDLKTVMEPSTQFNKLRASIVSGQAMFITGTGVSVAACGDQEVDGHKVASWMGLLEHGAYYFKTIGAADDKAIERLIENIRSGETDFMIGAAETIERRWCQLPRGERPAPQDEPLPSQRLSAGLCPASCPLAVRRETSGAGPAIQRWP
jgi:hypothetical protein